MCSSVEFSFFDTDSHMKLRSDMPAMRSNCFRTESSNPESVADMLRDLVMSSLHCATQGLVSRNRHEPGRSEKQSPERALLLQSGREVLVARKDSVCSGDRPEQVGQKAS